MERFFVLELTAGLLTIDKERHNPNLHNLIIGKQKGGTGYISIKKKRNSDSEQNTDER